MFNKMKRTARQSLARTLADLLAAMGGSRVVTITYTDRAGDETVRTIEIRDIRTTKKGAIVVSATCRLRGDKRTFRPEQIVAYTVHRMRFEQDIPTDELSVARAARTAAELIALELDRDYPDLKPMKLAA
ncbi:WYL domain-containing protein [Streptomyces sp. NPDC048430]|uniref:WYL domain-containing protein n=1 Tax=Streptomyces sp. NPDC048430 TaxID=3155388 RepID=UPI003444F083